MRLDSSAWKWVRVLLLGAVALSAAVFLRRGVEAWRAAERPPGVATTSGYEEESLFQVWKVVHGQAAFADPHRPPYAAAYFNWLFYRVYGGWCAPIVKRVADHAIPTAGRMLTAIGALTGALALGLTLARSTQLPAAWTSLLAGFVYFGPLVGWWAWTVRPDVWGLALETIGVGFAMSASRRASWLRLGAAIIAFYLAWAFKPTFICGLGTCVLYLSVRGRRGMAVWLLAASAGLWVATFALGTEQYRAMVASTLFHNQHGYGVARANLRDAALKLTPLLLMAAAACLRLPERSEPGRSELSLVGMIGLAVSLPIALVSASKVGAWSNYYFTVALTLTLVVAARIDREPLRARWLVGAAAVVAIQFACLFGWIGRMSLQSESTRLFAEWKVWRSQAQPRYAHDTRLNLPWLNGESVPYVLAANYQRDRTSGLNFEGGGVGHMIEAGEFRSLLLPAASTERYDGGSLRRYERITTVGEMTVFRRKDSQ